MTYGKLCLLSLSSILEGEKLSEAPRDLLHFSPLSRLVTCWGGLGAGLGAELHLVETDRNDYKQIYDLLS